MKSSDERARGIAARQAGVVHVAQLRACGLSNRQIQVRTERGEFVRRHRGVLQYAGSEPTFTSRVWAALLACGGGAFASHRTAAVLWGIRRTEPDVIDITVPTAHRPKLCGVHVHRDTRPGSPDTRRRDGARLSSPRRTICELAAGEPRDEVEYAIQEAAVRRLLTPAELRAAADAWSPKPGSSLLRNILIHDGNGDFARSQPERRLRRLLDAAGLPRPLQNVHVRGHRVDFAWPALRLIVELDGHTTHGTAVAFRADRAMDAELIAAGWRVMRFPARMGKDELIIAIARITQVLEQAASR